MVYGDLERLYCRIEGANFSVHKAFEAVSKGGPSQYHGMIRQWQSLANEIEGKIHSIDNGEQKVLDKIKVSKRDMGGLTVYTEVSKDYYDDFAQYEATRLKWQELMEPRKTSILKRAKANPFEKL